MRKAETQIKGYPNIYLQTLKIKNKEVIIRIHNINLNISAYTIYPQHYKSSKHLNLE